MRSQLSHQRGFSVLEVAIGIFIFAVGALALSLLQGNLTRGQAAANSLSVATNIGEQLIEQTRGFGTLSAIPGSTIPAYENIRESQFQTLGLTFDRGGLTYTAAVNLLDYRWDGDSFECYTGELDNGSDSRCISGTIPAGVYSDYKLMEVTVTWEAPEFQIQDGVATTGRLGSGSVLISGIISSVSSGASGRIATNDPGGVELPPISYTPGLKPDVIPIEIGENKFKEALTPVPDVIRTGKVETAFEVVTYSQVGGDATFLRQEEFLAVNCTCTLGSGNAQARRPAIWVGDEYGGMQWANKPYGTVPNNVQQSEHCSVCCRDHHDGGSPVDATNAPDNADTYANVFGPFKAAGEYAGAARVTDHIHYQENGTTVAQPNQNYLEACRMVRVEGFWRVAQDFRREDQYVFPVDFLDENAEIATYSLYVAGNPTATPAVKGAVEKYYDEALNIESGTPPGTGVAYPSAPPCIGLDSNNDGVEDNGCLDKPVMGGAFSTALGPGEFPRWTALVDGTVDTQQLRSRGIYIDYMQADLRAYLETCITNGVPDENCSVGEVELDKTGSGNLLEILPFFDVQLTMLNRWNETPANIPVDTTNEPIADANAHSRGVISQVSVYGPSDVRAESQRGNTGFTDTPAIEPLAIYGPKVTRAYLNVQSQDSGGVGGPTPPAGTNYGGSIAETVTGNPNIIVTGNSGVNCGQTAATWTCTVEAGTLTPVVTVSGYQKNNNGENRYACIAGLTGTTVDTGFSAGSVASATFSLAGFAGGATYNLVIKTTPCS